MTGNRRPTLSFMERWLLLGKLNLGKKIDFHFGHSEEGTGFVK